MDDYQSAMSSFLSPELQGRLMSMFGAQAQDPNSRIKQLLATFQASGAPEIQQSPIATPTQAPMEVSGAPGVAASPATGLTVNGAPGVARSPQRRSSSAPLGTVAGTSGPIKDPTPIKPESRGPIKFGSFTVDQLKDPKNLRRLQNRRPKAAERYASFIKDHPNGKPGKPSKPSQPDKPAPPAGSVPPGAVAKASSMFNDAQISRLRRRGSVRPGK